jgi:hypothetical protein
MVFGVNVLFLLLASRPPDLLRGYVPLVIARIKYISNYTLVEDLVANNDKSFPARHFEGKATGVSMLALANDLQKRYPVQEGWLWQISNGSCGANCAKGDLTLSPRTDGAVGVYEDIILRPSEVLWIRLTKGSNVFQPGGEWP